MSEADPRALIAWYKNHARALLEKTVEAEKLAEFDKECAQLANSIENSDTDLTVCFLGSSGIGKSTLTNALLGSVRPVVPSGGVGPLTAQALVIEYGDTPALEVHYHGVKPLRQTIFGMESMFRSELGESTVAVEDITDADEELDEAELPFESNEPDSEGDEETLKAERREQFRRRAQLMVAGSQELHRDVKYLLDSLYETVGKPRKWGTLGMEEDAPRIASLQRSLDLGRSGRPFKTSGSIHDPTFRSAVSDHATGFLAPLIKTLVIKWSADLLKDGIVLVDLPGVGVVRDLHKDVTRKWIREKAKALVLVVDHRGLTEPVAAALKKSEFLNSLLYSADEPEDDPILIVVVTRVDDVALERYKHDENKIPSEHFQEIVKEVGTRVRDEVRRYLDQLWIEGAETTEGRRQVARNVLNTLQVHPLSAVEYAKVLAKNRFMPPFLETLEETGVPNFTASLSELARRRKKQIETALEERRHLFEERVSTTLKLIEAQWQADRHAEEEVAKLREDLEVFMQPLREQFTARRGEYRGVLRKQIPKRIEDLVNLAKERSIRETQQYLNRLGYAHWMTLKASVRRGGRYSGASEINLPDECGAFFEAAIAELWSKEILKDIRRETKDYANACVRLTDSLAEWALNQGARVQAKVVEAQRDAIRAEAKQLENVGRDMIREMRDEAKAQLIATIEGPIRKSCDDFIRLNRHVGIGVKGRILGLYSELPVRVIEAAAPPAMKILNRLFKDVEKEILETFSQQESPLEALAQAIVVTQHKYLERSDAQKKRRIIDELSKVYAAMPAVNPV